MAPRVSEPLPYCLLRKRENASITNIAMPSPPNKYALGYITFFGKGKYQKFQ